MSKGAHRWIGAALLAAVAWMPAPAGAQGPAASSLGDYDLGWHIVRPGENLHYIARKYVGDKNLWRETWELNPQIQDPDVLKPGERVRVYVERRQSVPTALLRSVAGQVEERPAPISWNLAREEDLLLEEDGIRTGPQASTEMEFQDGTRITMTEESLLYLRRQGRRLTGVPPKSVEIVEGQAEVAASRPPGEDRAVEILVGGTRAVARPDESGVAKTRARRADDDAAKVMVYEGGTEVRSGGETVAVARGMGTSVEQGRAPGPPEKLLPAPEGLLPEPGARLSFNNIALSWQPVEGAASYTVELCSDAGCGLLVERVVGLDEAGWEPAAPPTGEYFWRVTAVSPSGLDGYPSPGAALAIFGGRDVTPPSGRVTVASRQILYGARRIVDENVRLEVELEDAQSGVAGWRPVIDGEEVTVERWSGRWPDGTYRASVIAVDRVGNEGPIPALEIEVDALPPVIRISGLVPPEQTPRLTRDERCSWLERSGWRWRSWGQCRYMRRAPRRWSKRGWEWLEVSSDRRLWSPLIRQGSEIAREVARRRNRLPAPPTSMLARGDLPQLFLRAGDGASLQPPVGGAASPTLRMWAADAGIGVEIMEVALGDEDGLVILRTNDVFGHSQELSWRPRP